MFATSIAAVFRPDNSAPASGARWKKIKAALAESRPTTRNAGGKSLASMAANEAREMRTTIPKTLHAAELPDWQDVRADVRVTAKQ